MGRMTEESEKKSVLKLMSNCSVSIVFVEVFTMCTLPETDNIG